MTASREWVGDSDANTGPNDPPPDASADALVDGLSSETFEQWVEQARKDNPGMTDEQLRAGWEAARALMGL